MFYLCSVSGTASSPPQTTVPTRSARLLGLVRKLIDYGRQLYTALQERTADVAAVTRDFGTRDIAAILRRIACGLERASALEARVVREAALLDAGPIRTAAPVRAPRGPSVAPRPRAPRAERWAERNSRIIWRSFNAAWSARRVSRASMLAVNSGNSTGFVR